MRAIFKPFAIHSAYSPIETIVFFSIIGTLAYFHVLSAIKHSSFFAPSYPATLSPAHALLNHDGQWVSARGSLWLPPSKGDRLKVEMQQIVFTLDSSRQQDINFGLVQLSESVLNATHQLTHAFQSSSGRKYPSICHRPSGPTSNTSLDTKSPCFAPQILASPRSFIQTLTFNQGTRDDFMEALPSTLKSLSTGDNSVRFEVEVVQPVEPIGQMRNGKWIAYAARALVLRFWDLGKKADSLDILLILLGYILMHTTFILLWHRSRSLGSNFWLPFSILCSSVLALLLSLPLALWLRIPMDPVALTEALPFLVCTVGFDKPLRFARAVFTHPKLMSTGPSSPGSGVPNTLVPSGKIVLDALQSSYHPIIRDYALEIVILVVGAYSKVGGLREVCALAAVLLAVDCCLLCTFLAAVFGIMVEVRRIKTVRDIHRSRNSVPSSPTSGGAFKPQSVLIRPEADTQSLSYKLSSAIIGVKGSMLPSKGKKEELKPDNPVARLKLLLIASFLILHVLNLCAPLSPPRFSTHALSVRKVDFTAPGIRSILDALVDAEQIVLPGDSDTETSTSTPQELLVKISPPVHVRVIPPPTLLSSVSPGVRTTSEMVENFMSSWTTLVGDPVLSKWIVMVLAISLSLNGYLLKGIAAGTVGKGIVTKEGVRFTEKEKAPEVREERVEEVRVEQVRLPRRPSFNVPPPIHVPTFTLDDVDKRLKQQHLTEASDDSSSSSEMSVGPADIIEARPLSECVEIFENGPKPASVALAMLNDEEVVMLAQAGKIAAYALEKVLGPNELERAVRVRRALISRASKTKTLEYSDIPMTNYDYSRVLGACCENVVGYIPLPLGIAGPLKIDGEFYPIPMATAEGTLVASTSRGCKALNAGGGVTTVLTQDSMTRGPAIDFPSIVLAAEAKAWIASEDGYAILKEAFESTSRFAKLTSMKTAMAGRTLFVRFATATGDAMGMNMISKGTEKALEVMQLRFPEMIVLALSGNYCTDKKAAAINWIEGRGKSVVAEAVIPGKIVKSVLKTTVESLCNLNTKKNLVGSAMAGALGGFNAHAANILTAVFLATGQDPAQNVVSSNCMTLMEPTNNGEDLLMTVSMPSIEVGTVGGGTVLGPQQAVLEMLGLKGAHPTQPGQNSQRLARLIAAGVMAGELSLLSALAAGHLIRAHMAHNRSTTNTPAASRPVTPGPVPSAGSSWLAAAPKAMKSSPLTPSESTTSLPPYSRD